MSQMKTFKRYLSMFLVLAALTVAMITPAAHSYVYGWDISQNSLYFGRAIEIDAKVVEDVGKSSKSNVKIQNIASSSCYVKTMIVFTPVDENGNILTNVTIDKSDIDITLSDYAVNNSKNADGGTWLALSSNLISNQTESTNTTVYPYMYIWNKPIASNGLTENLIDSLTIKTTEYDIKVDIIADAIYEAEISNWCSAYGLTCSDTGVLTVA